jgi:glycerol uptake facilitator-like aquaporin
MEGTDDKSSQKDLRNMLLISEFIGTLMLVFFGSGAMAAIDTSYEGFAVSTDRTIGIALVHVIVYAIFVYATSNKVKCTFNPVISLIRIIRRKWTLLEVAII